MLRREPPFKTIFGYALVFGEDGRPMHKSWGNAIDFDEAAERMGVDVMRWMFAKARPEENILFGWHAADEARRELLVLWNVYAFFVTYARLAGWTPAEAAPAGRGAARPRSLDPVAGRRPRPSSSRTACATPTPSARRARSSTFIDDLSTWYLRLSRRRFSRAADPPERSAAFATLHEALDATVRTAGADPAVPRPTPMYVNLATRRRRRARQRASDRAGRRRRWPRYRDAPLEAAMAVARGAVDLARTLRSSARIRTRQPLARAWLAVPDRCVWTSAGAADADRDRDQRQATSSVIDDDSDLVERRVKPLLPRIGKRLGGAIPAVMAAARDGAVEYPRGRRR